MIKKIALIILLLSSTLVPAEAPITPEKSISWQFNCAPELGEKTVKALEPLMLRAFPFLKVKKLHVTVHTTLSSPEKLIYKPSSALNEPALLDIAPFELFTCSKHSDQNLCSASCSDPQALENTVAFFLAFKILKKDVGTEYLKNLVSIFTGITLVMILDSFKLLPQNHIGRSCAHIGISTLLPASLGIMQWFSFIKLMRKLAPHRYSSLFHYLLPALPGILGGGFLGLMYDLGYELGLMNGKNKALKKKFAFLTAENESRTRLREQIATLHSNVDEKTTIRDDFTTLCDLLMRKSKYATNAKNFDQAENLLSRAQEAHQKVAAYNLQIKHYIDQWNQLDDQLEKQITTYPQRLAALNNELGQAFIGGLQSNK